MEIAKCRECCHRFPNNPKKHQNRPKLCPKCHKAYTKTGINWKPNLSWLKNKIFKTKEKKQNRLSQLRQRTIKSYKLSMKREPSEMNLVYKMFQQGSEAEKRWLTEEYPSLRRYI